MMRTRFRLCSSSTLSQKSPHSLPRCDVPLWSSFASQLSQKSIFDLEAFNPIPIIPGPTLMFQNSLPRLPIPKLTDTCQRYLAMIKPLVNDSCYAQTHQKVLLFQNGPGIQLQTDLVTQDRRNAHTSFINEHWFQLYLSDRTPLPIHYNPFLVMRNEPRHLRPSCYLEKASYMAAILTQWFYRLKQNQLPPEVFFFGSSQHYSKKAWFRSMCQYLPDSIRTLSVMAASSFHVFPLDMVQFKHSFASTRIPGKDMDSVCSFYDEDPLHIVIHFKGKPYIVSVAQSVEKAMDIEQSAANILRSLREIIQQDESVTGMHPEEEVSVLTSERRDIWYAQRTEMEKNTKNVDGLRKIDSALFVLNLDDDDETPGDLLHHEDVLKMGRRHMCHDTNRWWDKSFSLTISKTGTVGINFEHSWGDGVAILRMVVDLYNQYMTSVQSYQTSKYTPDQASNWKAVSFQLNTVNKIAIQKAHKRLREDMQRLDYTVNVYPFLGKKDVLFRHCAEIKPDPFVQLAFQLAWYRLNQTTVSTYESASTSAFLHGRTECIRSATIESRAFTLAMDDRKISRMELYILMKKAMKKHAANSKDAKMGQGVDRHLFALRKQAGQHVHDIFTDAAYTALNSNMMSTSTLYSDALMMGGFGPVSSGYGIGYSAADDLILFSISAWKTEGPSYTCEQFAHVLYQSIKDLHELCLEGLNQQKNSNVE